MKCWVCEDFRVWQGVIAGDAVADSGGCSLVAELCSEEAESLR